MPMSEELKARMKAGREAAKLRRQQEAAQNQEMPVEAQNTNTYENKASPAKSAKPAGVSQRAWDAYRHSIQAESFQQKLYASPIPGWKLHWASELDGMLESRLGSGWDFVTQAEQAHNPLNTDSGGKVSVIGGSKPSGEPYRMYLLKIPEEWYLQQKKREQQQLDKVNQTIHRGSLNNGIPAGKQYTPREGRSIGEELK